ncbi:hypothetical protein OXIME_000388 [Oxyplasma meridianum]|uniref:DUF2062 domain-containing protein n=1 Tax=Oxyplasma meridianum TaxID=3073602 RepID=A0AAX4NEE3_9ARCH
MSMTLKRSRIKTLKDSWRDWTIYRSLKKNESMKSMIYSQPKGIFYGIIFSLIMWWIPIAGPATAGYIAGRSSGTPSKALVSTLVATSILMILTMMFLPFKTGVLSSIGNYLSSGVIAISGSKLVAYSGFLTDLYTSYGILKTLTIIMPGSLIILNVFGYAGGFISQIKRQEENYSAGYLKNRVGTAVVNRERKSKIDERKIIREFKDARNDDEDGVGDWTYL